MKNFIKTKTPFIIVCLGFVLFNMLYFVTTNLPNANASKWIGYAFITISFIVMGAIALLLNLKSKNTMTTIWPLMYATVGYFAVSFLVNSILMIVNGDGKKGPLVLNFIIIILYAVVFLISFKSFSRVADNTAVREARVAQLRELSVKVNALTFLAKDEEVKKAILKLKEDIDYSSSAGTAATASYEKQLEDYVITIQTLLAANGDPAAVLEAVSTMANILKVRNQMLMVTRH